MRKQLHKRLITIAEAFSEPFQTFMTERFAKIVNAKRSFLDVSQGSEYASV